MPTFTSSVPYRARLLTKETRKRNKTYPSQKGSKIISADDMYKKIQNSRNKPNWYNCKYKINIQNSVAFLFINELYE